MRPLDDRVLNRIKVNVTVLTQLIALESGLVAELYAKRSVTNFQKQAIEGSGVSVQIIKRLLDTMSRKSVFDFNHFLSLLQDTQQGNVAAFLLKEDAGKLNADEHNYMKY